MSPSNALFFKTTHNSSSLFYRALLKYEIHYRKISDEIQSNRDKPEKALTKYGGRDACGGDEWTITDHKPSEGTVDPASGEIKWLGEAESIPTDKYSWYAVFVKTIINKDLDKGLDNGQVRQMNTSLT